MQHKPVKFYEESDYATRWTREEQQLLQKAPQDAYLKQFQPEPVVLSLTY
jgi:hypothetical protein